MCSRVRCVAILLFLLPLSAAQAPDKKDKPDSPARKALTFRLPVNVVVVNATVLDKQGNPIRDLVQGDFKVYEDGKLQPIHTFAVESYQPDQTAMPANNEVAAVEKRPRMMALLIDDITASSRDNFPRVVEAVRKYIAEDLRPEDQVTLSAGSGRFQFPFSSEKQTLLEELNTVLGKLSLDRLIKDDCPSLTDFQPKKISESFSEDQDAKDIDLQVAIDEAIQCLALDPGDSSSRVIARNQARIIASRQTQESEYRSGLLLHALRAHTRTLKHFDAAKSLVLFSDGFLAQGVSQLSYQLQDVVEQALSSGVSLNTVDIRGLYTSMVSADERTITSAPSSSYKQMLFMEDMAAQEAPLAQMAHETGGLFFHNSNDMHDGLKKIARRNSFYYVLTYAMPSQRSDGHYHQIKLEVERPGVELSYRKGYYAPKEELTFERRKKEDIMDAIRSPGNLNEIPIALAYNYYQEDTSSYVLALSTNISIRRLHFLEENSRRKNLINIVVAAFDETDRYVDGIEKSIDFKLVDESYLNILKYGINSKVELKLPMGRYKIKAVVRESMEGKMGSATRTAEIP